VLDQIQQQFGIDLTQDLVWLLRPPMIHRQISFPQLEKQFNLPTEPL
jgi:hypothetical protein